MPTVSLTSMSSRTRWCRSQSVTGPRDSLHQVRHLSLTSKNKSPCTYKDTCSDALLLASADFDLASWYNSLGIRPGSVLSAVNRDKLLNELGIKSYLSTNPCLFTSPTFTPTSSKGWKNGECCQCRY